MTSIRDITERKQAEKALQESEQRFRAFFENVAVGTVQLDLSGRFVEVNDRLCRMTGYSREELLTMTPWNLTHPDDREPAEKPLQQYLHGNEPLYDAQKRYVRKDGSVIWVQVTAGMIRDASGKPVRSAGIIQDITDRKQAEEELAESEQRLSLTLESGQMGAWEWDVTTNTSIWNAKEYELLGLPVGDGHVETDQILRHIHPEDRAGFDESLAQIFKDGSDWRHEFRVIRADGEVRYLAGAGRLFRDDQGNPLRMIGVNYDITDRKKAEEALAVAKDLLEHHVYLLQRALVPAKPSIIEGYSVASAYIPAYAGTEIGGDFLDVFRTEDGKVGILIGDVSGKGIESASLAAITRSTVRAFAYDSSSSGDALTHANSLLSTQQVDYMQFVTSFLAILDPATGEVTYSSAGHPPAAISSENGDTELLCSHGMPLGVMGGVEYEEGCYTLGPGDKLVLYTDGITEARRGTDLFETVGVERVLKAHVRANSYELVEAILNAVKDWTHGKLRDDTAVLIVGREG